jgi:hypothetical protein
MFLHIVDSNITDTTPIEISPQFSASKSVSFREFKVFVWCCLVKGKTLQQNLAAPRFQFLIRSAFDTLPHQIRQIKVKRRIFDDDPAAESSPENSPHRLIEFFPCSNPIFFARPR